MPARASRDCCRCLGEHILTFAPDVADVSPQLAGKGSTSALAPVPSRTQNAVVVGHKKIDIAMSKGAAFDAPAIHGSTEKLCLVRRVAYLPHNHIDILADKRFNGGFHADVNAPSYRDGARDGGRDEKKFECHRRHLAGTVSFCQCRDGNSLPHDRKFAVALSLGMADWIWPGFGGD
jgi:hypothetical protein